MLPVIYTLVRGSLQFISHGSIPDSIQILEGRKMGGTKARSKLGAFMVLIKARTLQAKPIFYFQAPHSEKWGCLETFMGFQLGKARAGHDIQTPPSPRARPLLAGQDDS